MTRPHNRPHLASPGRDELVYHYLRPIGEIAKLRFPYDQLVRFRGGIPVFEAEHGLFRQQ